MNASVTYHFAFAGVVDQLSKDVSLLVDSDEDGPVTAADLSDRLELFLAACGWEGATVTIQ